MGKGVEGVGSCFELFSKWVRERGGATETGGIYSDPLVMWLMTYQRLNEGASLARALEQFAGEGCWELAGRCKRREERKASAKTGGYAQARTNLSVKTVKLACDDLFEWLSSGGEKDLEGRLYALDGSTVELLRSAELVQRFPSHSERGHYPLMRILVCHHLRTGLAVRPEYGAMYGRYRQGEIALCKAMVGRLPKDAILVADRNFGIFAAAHCAKNAGLEVIFRLQDQRAKKVLGRTPVPGTDQPVQWRASSQDLKNNPELPLGAELSGRVICMNVSSCRGGKVTPLCLFTTLQLPAEKIVALYGLRWGIEIDLRTLKQTVSMKMLRVHSEDMAQKELLIGICAYNLVRTVIRHAAAKLGQQPRDFSFKRILYAVDACGAAFSQASSAKERERIINFFWNSVDAAKHPKRKRKRVEPRAVVRNRRQKYPSLTTTRAQARAKLMKKTK
jgi:hypothetical protein